MQWTQTRKGRCHVQKGKDTFCPMNELLSESGKR